jgi:hypothetical protein
MQPGNYITEFCEHMLLFIKQRKGINDLSGLHLLVKQIRTEGINFAIADDMRTTPSIASYDIVPYGALRPPYLVTIVENLTEFGDGDKLPTVLIALDIPSQEETWWTYSVKEFVPSRKDPTKLQHAWRVPLHVWTLPYKHCGKFSEDGEPQIAMAPHGTISTEIHEQLIKESNMSAAEYKAAHATAAAVFLEIYAGFCAAIHGHEVTFTDVEPDAAKNKMRRARGKVPLFTYKVLTIGKPKRKSRHLGGTHASPRSHLRRGYYRTSRNGVRHWVQPCMVKGETDGFVHKDYKVEGTVH